MYVDDWRSSITCFDSTCRLITGNLVKDIEISMLRLSHHHHGSFLRQSAVPASCYKPVLCHWNRRQHRLRRVFSCCTVVLVPLKPFYSSSSTRRDHRQVASGKVAPLKSSFKHFKRLWKESQSAVVHFWWVKSFYCTTTSSIGGPFEKTGWSKKGVPTSIIRPSLDNSFWPTTKLQLLRHPQNVLKSPRIGIA